MTSAANNTSDPVAVMPSLDGWIEKTLVGADTVLVPQNSSASFGADFQPNLVLMWISAGAPIEELSVAAMANAFEGFTACVMHSCEVWDEQDAPGRLITFSYELDGRAIQVLQWIWKTATHAVYLTASCSTFQLLAVEPFFVSVASQVLLTEAA